MRCVDPSPPYPNRDRMVRFHDGPLDGEVYEADAQPGHVYYRRPLDVEEELGMSAASFAPRRMLYRPIHRYDRVPGVYGPPAVYRWVGQQEQVEVSESCYEVLYLPQHRGRP